MMATVNKLGMRVARAWEEHCMKGETSIYGSGSASHLALQQHIYIWRTSIQLLNMYIYHLPLDKNKKIEKESKKFS